MAFSWLVDGGDAITAYIHWDDPSSISYPNIIDPSMDTFGKSSIWMPNLGEFSMFF